MNKRILVITAFVPSRISAGENFTRQMLNDLSEDNHVDLIYFKYPGDKDYLKESDNVNVIKVFRNNSFIKIFNCMLFPFLFPLFTVRFNLFRLNYINSLIKSGNYNFLLLDFSQTFLYGRYVKNVKVILNCHDVNAQRYSRIFNGIFLPFVKISERFVMRGKEFSIFNHSEKDSNLLFNYYGIRSLVTNLYLDDQVCRSVPLRDEGYFVLFANWKRKDNLNGLSWFIGEVYPFLRDELKFKVIGSGLTGRVLKSVTSLHNFEYLGFVDNPYSLISNASALVSPLFTGAGIKVKVAESLACGTQVIGTPVSFEGISNLYSNYMLEVTTKDDFISAINGYSTNIELKLELKRLFASSGKGHAISDFINGL